MSYKLNCSIQKVSPSFLLFRKKILSDIVPYRAQRFVSSIYNCLMLLLLIHNFTWKSCFAIPDSPYVSYLRNRETFR